jgi:ankyrin repeat protein
MHQLLRLATAAVSLLVLCAVGSAQMIPTTVVNSAEATVQDAETIVIGKVASVELPPAHLPQWKRIVTAIVEETLKGPKRDRVVFAVPDRNVAYVEHLFRTGDRVLVGGGAISLVESTDNPALLQRLLSGPMRAEEKSTSFNLSDPSIFVLNADFSVARGPEAVLRRFRELIRTEPPDPAPLLIQVSPSPEAALPKPLANYGHVVLRVPADTRLVTRILEDLASRSLARRKYALDVLRQFKSERAIEPLKQLLNDRHRELVLTAAFNKGYDIYRFPIRESAYNLLTDWKVPVSQPVLEEKVSRLSSVERIRVWNAQLSDDDLVQLLRAPRLRSLELPNVTLSHAHLKDIAQLSGVTNLSLMESRFSEADLQQISRMPDLESLDLKRTQLTDTGLAALTRLPKLRDLDVSETRVTRSGLSHFRIARPDVHLRSRPVHSGPRPISNYALHYAAASGDLEAARKALNQDPSLLNSVDSDDRTALHYAAAADAAEVVALLLQKGADPDRQTKVGVTPLHWATEFDSSRVIPILIKHGLNLELARRDGGTITLSNGQRVTRSYTPLASTLLDGIDNVSIELITAGADVNRKNGLGDTPLMIAVASGRPVSLLKLLISRGADVDAVNIVGDTALHIAAMRADRPAIRALLEHGADPFTRNGAGKRPFDLLPP